MADHTCARTKDMLVVGVCPFSGDIVVVSVEQRETVLHMPIDDALTLASALVEMVQESRAKTAKKPKRNEAYDWASVVTNPRRPMGDA